MSHGQTQALLFEALGFVLPVPNEPHGFSHHFFSGLWDARIVSDSACWLRHLPNIVFDGSCQGQTADRVDEQPVTASSKTTQPVQTILGDMRRMTDLSEMRWDSRALVEKGR
jgi:hypothetical protein